MAAGAACDHAGGCEPPQVVTLGNALLGLAYTLILVFDLLLQITPLSVATAICLLCDLEEVVRIRLPPLGARRAGREPAPHGTRCL